MKRMSMTFAMLTLLVTPSLGMLVSPSVGAVDVFGACTDTTTRLSTSNTSVCQEAKKPVATNPIVQIIQVVIDIISAIIGVSAVIIIIISSFRMITAAGNSQQVASARTGIIYAAIGLVIAVSAVAIVNLVLSKL